MIITHGEILQSVTSCEQSIRKIASAEIVLMLLLSWISVAVRSETQSVGYYWCRPPSNFPGWCDASYHNELRFQQVTVSWPLTPSVKDRWLLWDKWLHIVQNQTWQHRWKVIWKENQFSILMRFCRKLRSNQQILLLHIGGHPRGDRGGHDPHPGKNKIGPPHTSLETQLSHFKNVNNTR